jgi:Protein of unknown function (DUF2568)
VGVLKVVSDVVAFVVELAAVAAVVVAALAVDVPVAVRVGLAVVGVAVFAAVWGRCLAPRANHRLVMPALLVAKAAVFVVSFALLAVAGQPVWAAVGAVVAAAHLVVATVNGWL